MKIEQIYTGCIAHAAYYLENDGEVCVLILQNVGYREVFNPDCSVRSVFGAPFFVFHGFSNNIKNFHLRVLNINK